MVDRRQVLLSGAAAVLVAGAGSTLARARGKSLSELLDTFVAQDLDASPEGATSLGQDSGARAPQRRALDDRSLESRAKQRGRIATELSRLVAFDRTSVSGMDRISYDVVLFCLQSTDVANKRYAYGPIGAGAPYVISPLTGAYSSIPDFLDGQHPILSRADADAYLSRLEGFAVALDQEIDTVRHDVVAGCSPPDFALSKTLRQLSALRGVAAPNSTLVSSLAKRVEDKNLDGHYEADAARIVSDKVYPALDRQMVLVRQMQARATSDAGVWKLPHGADYYSDSLITWTSSPLNSSEIHTLGLNIVADYTSRIDAVMKRQGMTTGTVPERLRAMFNDRQFLYSNDDVGREKLLADLNARVRLVRSRLPQYFGVLPKAEVIVKRVPPYMEGARPSGYYQPPSLAGDRPGAYYINLRDLAETPTWTLPTHTYHESVPGHHMKGSIYQETKLPLIRKLDFYSAYMEGWSLYAEHLADEMGLYDDDPFGRIGYLHGALRAGAAMVIDTGLHTKRWSREDGIRYFTSTLGDPEASATTEVERYCIWPAQVCSYMLDLMAILELREHAKARLGARFDIRHFHDAILLCGPVPQKVLAGVVDDFIKRQVG
jgi:uncharacterized protein (DUF885 family)